MKKFCNVRKNFKEIWTPQKFWKTLNSLRKKFWKKCWSVLKGIWKKSREIISYKFVNYFNRNYRENEEITGKFSRSLWKTIKKIFA